MRAGLTTRPLSYRRGGARVPETRWPGEITTTHQRRGYAGRTRTQHPALGIAYTLLREQIARLDERLARLGTANGSSPAATQREEMLAQRTELARQLDAMGPDPRAKMG